MLTHGHTDHIAGTNSIKKYCKARIFLPEKSIPEATDAEVQEQAVLPDSVREISLTLRNYDILDNFDKTCGEWVLKKDDISAINDGDELQAGAYTFQAIPTSGHDIGMMVFYEPSRKLLLTADLLKGLRPGNALPWYSSSAGGPGEYLASLDMVEKLSVKDALPSHGILKGSFIEAVGHTRDAILKREAEIVASLKNGPKTCDQLDNILFSPILLEVCLSAPSALSCWTSAHGFRA
ncbi:MAG: MBL fold metallo-hydrolase [Deltaproteobacteria bacterium]